MSNPEQSQDKQANAAGDEHPQGPNLILLYSIVAIAIAAAIGFAMLIVLPFYHRH